MIKKLIRKLRTPLQPRQSDSQYNQATVARANDIDPNCCWVVFWVTVDEEDPRYAMDDGMTSHFETHDNEAAAIDQYEGLYVSELEKVYCCGYAPIKAGSEPHWVSK